MRKLSVIIIISIMFLFGCASNTKMISDFPKVRENIESIIIVEPHIYLEKKLATGSVLNNEGIIEEKAKLWDLYFEQLSREYKCDKFELNKETDLGNEISALFIRLNASPDVTQVELNQKLKEAIAQSESKYYLFSYQAGFTSTGGNVGKEIAKSIFVAVITFGMFYTVPLVSTSDLYMAIYDKGNDQIIYYDKNHSDINPTKKNLVEKQVEKVLKNILKDRDV